MQRRKFSREFKLEAVRLVKDRGVSVAQAARDLDLHENGLRNGSGRRAVIRSTPFPEAAALDSGRPEPRRVRGASDPSSTACPKNRQQANLAEYFPMLSLPLARR